MSGDIIHDHAVDHALDFGAAGWRVLPLSGKAPHRLAGKWGRTATTDPTKIKRWAADPSVTGFGAEPPAGVVVLDFDGSEGLALAIEYQLDRSPGMTSGGGGLHRPFRWSGDQLPAKMYNDGGEKVGEVKQSRGYIVLPSSLHPSGALYTADAAFDVGALPELSPAIAETIRANADRRVKATLSNDGQGSPVLQPRSIPTTGATLPPDNPRVRAWAWKALTGCEDDVSRAVEGMRNQTLNDCAYRLGRLAMACDFDAGDVSERLVSAAVAAGLKQGEARDTFASGWNAGIASPRECPIDVDDDHVDVDDGATERRRAAIRSEAFDDAIRSEREAAGARAPSQAAIESARVVADAIIEAAKGRPSVAIGHGRLRIVTGFGLDTVSRQVRRVIAAGVIERAELGGLRQNPKGWQTFASVYVLAPLELFGLSDKSEQPTNHKRGLTEKRYSDLSLSRKSALFSPATHDSAVHPASVRQYGETPNAVRAAYLELDSTRQAITGRGLGGAATLGALIDLGSATIAEIAEVTGSHVRTVRRHIEAAEAAGAVAEVGADATGGRSAARYAAAVGNLTGEGGPVSTAIVDRAIEAEAARREAALDFCEALSDPTRRAGMGAERVELAPPISIEERKAARSHGKAPRFGAEALALRSTMLAMGIDPEDLDSAAEPIGLAAPADWINQWAATVGAIVYRQPASVAV